MNIFIYNNKLIYNDDDTSYMVINDIYDSIVLRDVVDRYKIRNIELLNRIMRYIMDNVGNTFSAKRISDYFKNKYRKVHSTVYNYIEALESSFIISKVNRYDVHIEGIKHINLVDFISSKTLF